MNKLKSEVIKIINGIPDEMATSFDELMEAVYVGYCALKGIEDMENGNVMTMEELRDEVANWK